ncbi:hypothetical protein ACJ7V3_07895 [Halomonas elongata]|uniref:hypothetical protein n=1 Tax=Halomonas elongata TaxID=2746 RepID=UPI0038D502B8
MRERLEKEVTSYLDTAEGPDSTGLAGLIDKAEAIDTEGYFDITKEAEDEKARVLATLCERHAAALERERLAAEREEIERERAELERLRAAQVPVEPKDPVSPSEPEAPAEPREMATTGGTVFGLGGTSPWDEALEDLISLGIDISAAECVLDAISNGDVRHVRLQP